MNSWVVVSRRVGIYTGPCVLWVGFACWQAVPGMHQSVCQGITVINNLQ